MAVTKARKDKPNASIIYNADTGKGHVEVHRGASGGGAPEGYGVERLLGRQTQGGVENAKVENEGVAQRGKEGDEARFKKADQWMKSKQEFEKKLAEGEPAHEALAAQKEKQEKEAAQKPTAAGAKVEALDIPGAAQKPEATKKEEAVDLKHKKEQK